MGDEPGSKFDKDPSKPRGDTPYPPPQPRVYIATPLLDYGKGVDYLKELEGGQAYLVTPINESECAGKIKALLLGTAIGFFLGTLTIGVCRR